MHLQRLFTISIATAATVAVTATGASAQDAAAPACQPMVDRMELDGRASPYDSTTIRVGDRVAKICYGRPSLRGRTMIGNPEYVPHGEIWRTGANEPTTLHIPFAAEIAGMEVEPGTYSIYTVPGESNWTVIVNRSTSQWGHESRYTEEVRAQEVGRARLPGEWQNETTETFTIRSNETGSNAAELVLEWQDRRTRIPIVASG